jgi:hypothetical protein
MTHLWHYRLSDPILDIPKRHLGTLMRIDLQVWKIDIWHLLQGYYEFIRTAHVQIVKMASTLFLHDHSGHSNSSIGGHLHWAQPTSLKAFLAKLRGSIYDENQKFAQICSGLRVRWGGIPRGGSSPFCG